MPASVSRTQLLAGAALLVAPFVFAQCTTAVQQPDPPGAPIAIIGELGEAAFIELGGEVVLDGSESVLGEHTDGLDLVLTYFWEVDTKPFGSLIVDQSLALVVPEEGDSHPGIVAFTPDLVGLYGVTLQVSDGVRVSDLDHVVISVGSGNTCPTADAGADVIAITGIPTTLDGTGSTDPDLDDGGEPQPLQWMWHFSLVPNGSALTDADIYSQGTDEPQIIPDVAGTYILQLRVTDGICTTEPQYVTVLATNGNGQPVADAGQSIILTPCSPSEVTLDGTGSFDAETASLSYEWRFTDSPVGSGISDAHIAGRYTASPSFNWDVPGVYTLSLRVSDGELVSEPDYVAVRAVPALPNQAPVAFAGEDLVLNSSANCQNSAYTGCSCTPCGARSVVLQANGSFDPDQDALNYQWDRQSGNVALSGAESLTVEVTFPEQPVNCNGTTTNTATLSLTVFDCRGADVDDITITLRCNG